jgi:hypothetical protein
MQPEPIRIAWQSSKAVHKFPAYQRALEEHAAKVMVTLRRVSNLEVSRVGHYAKPPRHQIDETYARFGLLKDAADPVANPGAAAPRKRNAA